jgi:twinkle protein
MKNKIPFQEYKEKLQERLNEVIGHLIGPIPQRGGYYTCGDLTGAAGKSLRINARTGVWEDFATGDKGDIIELFKFKNPKGFISDIQEFLGIRKSYQPSAPMQKPKKDWDNLEHGDFAYSYFDRRGISEETVDKYSRFIKKKGDSIVYLCGTKKDGLVYAHYKSPDKSHNPYGTKDSQKCLWGHDHSSEEEAVIITEGMEDALCFAEQGCGIPVVSVPCGAENLKWTLLSSSWLRHCKKIYIATDNDQPGDKLAEYIVSSFGARKCLRIKFGAAKDANEFHLNDESGEGLKKLIENSVEIRPKGIMNLKDVIEYRDAKRTGASVIELPLIDWKEFQWRLRLSELTVVTGETTCGKSTLLYNAAVYYAAVQTATVGVISPELDPDMIMDNFASIASGDRFSEIYRSRHHDALSRLQENCNDLIHIVNAAEDRSERQIFKWLDYLADIGSQVIIIDALQDLGMDMYDNSVVAAFMRRIQQFAKDSRAHVFLTAHTRKAHDDASQGSVFNSDSFPATKQILGSNAIGTMAFNIIAVIRNTKKQDVMLDPQASDEQRAEVTGQPDGGIKVLKDKNSGMNKGSVLYYYIEPESKRLIPDQREMIVTKWI